MQRLKLDPVDDIKGVNDVTQRFAHLPTLRVADETVAVNLSERDLASQLETEHDHPADPEGHDIPTRFQRAGGEEVLVVLIFGIGPAESGHRPQPGAEPSIEAVRILLQTELLRCELRLSLGLGFLRSPSNNPQGIIGFAVILTLKDDAVGWNPVTPPRKL